jgi:hypothetical protein
MCTGRSYYSLACAPDIATIHCPVHQPTTHKVIFSSVLSPFDFNFWEDFPET